MKFPLLNIDGGKNESIEISDKLVKVKVNHVFSSLRTCVALIPLRALIDVSAAHARASGPGAFKTQQNTPCGGGEFKGKATKARPLGTPSPAGVEGRRTVGQS